MQTQHRAEECQCYCTLLNSITVQKWNRKRQLSVSNLTDVTAKKNKELNCVETRIVVVTYKIILLGLNPYFRSANRLQVKQNNI